MTLGGRLNLQASHTNSPLAIDVTSEQQQASALVLCSKSSRNELGVVKELLSKQFKSAVRPVCLSVRPNPSQHKLCLATKSV